MGASSSGRCLAFYNSTSTKPAQTVVGPVPAGLFATPLEVALAFAMAWSATSVTASDQLVQVRCIPGTPPMYTLDPDTVVVAAGVDRILFQSPSYGDPSACDVEYQAPHIGFVLWP